jgi:hypothetical protein
MLEDKTHKEMDALLEDVLKTEPAYVLPDNFAEKLVQKVDRHFAWEQYLKEFLIYLAVIAGIVALSVASAFWLFNADWKEWLSFVTQNAAWLVAIKILAVFILFADRVVLRYFMYKNITSDN